MSLPADYSASINLYCNEAASEFVSSEADINPVESLSSSSQLTTRASLIIYSILSLIKCRKPSASYYQFRPETAYLSVNYLDRFLSFHTLPYPFCLSHSSDIIISMLRVINFLDYTPSSIAAAAVLWVTNQTIDDPKLGCFHNRVNKDMVKRCYNLIKKNMSKLSHGKVLNGTIPARCHARKFCNKGFKSSHSSPPNKC
ncbi:hypothetical protein GH714_015824 [Hevea brasiliensis]|uniref:Cyclin C-terminal domain-containing protein n=1 Tax=Hevea brasiliensis TaxID=3981 RepID=A0A6A6L217_HEVBR|nr:hypothetical protein GH714_015824 [Hevea brasiliensis]